MKSLVLKTLMLIMILQHVTTVLCKPTIVTTTTATAQAPVERMPPMYELQLAVWPTDVDDIIEAVVPTNNNNNNNSIELPLHTLVEEPVVVTPNLNEGLINNLNDDEYDDEGFDVVYDPSSDLWPTIIGKPEPTSPNPNPIIALENYHHKYNNGSEEYKLVLSNGMVNYQRIDHVLVKGVLKPVQQGYYTVPSPGTREFYQTTYYRADKNGYHVYKTEKSARNPAYDVYVQHGRNQDSGKQ